MSAGVQQRNLLPSSIAVSGKWLEPLRDWPRELMRALEGEPSVARVIIASVRGSAPREPGVCMIVARDRICGTIGGGHLESVAIDAARSLLSNPAAPAALLSKFVLGTELAQCCGGVVELWIERYCRSDLPTLLTIASAVQRENTLLISTLTAAGVERRVVPASGYASDERRTLLREAGEVRLREPLSRQRAEVWLYGAGHVGQALVRILSGLPIRLTWIDSRGEFLPADVFEEVQVVHAIDPVATVAAVPANAHVLVMTHSHALDYLLCRALLERGDYASVGVIGSASKAARFRSRLARDGVAARSIGRLACPIGVAGIGDKSPAAIAVSVAARLLQMLAADTVRSDPDAPSQRDERSVGADASCAGCATQCEHGR